jgi:endo-1,4-beta-xylanase
MATVRPPSASSLKPRLTLPQLFDLNGNPKPVTYEVMARLARYATGAPELCATALGTGECTVTY